MFKQRIILVTWVIILQGFFSANVKSATVTVVTEYLAPFQVKKEDGTLGGYSTEVVNKLFELVNMESTIHVLPWARAYRMALNEPNVMIYSIAKTYDREPLFQWVGSLKPQRFYFWGLKDKFPQGLKLLEDAKKYRISVSKDYDSALLLQKYHFPHLFLTTQDNQNIGMLLKNRVEAIVATESVLRSIAVAKNYDFEKFKKLIEIPELNNDLNIAFSEKSDKQLVNRFKVAYKYLKDTGELAKIQQKWAITNR